MTFLGISLDATSFQNSKSIYQSSVTPENLRIQFAFIILNQTTEQ